MTDAPPTKPRRRTQEERRASTTAAILDATLECLIEFGYAGTTAVRVTDRAGVSRGAQVHHYPTKAALVAAAVEHLAARRIVEIRDRFAGTTDLSGTPVEILDALWAIHSGPLFVASLELWTAARTDPELREHVAPIERTVNAAIVDHVAQNVESWNGSETAAVLGDLSTALSAMRGLAFLNLTMHVDDATALRRWVRTRGSLERLFGA